MGLKGTLAEAELHLIRARLDGGLRNKAARGELELSLPVGLDRGEDGRIGLSADEQVRHAIGRVFELWRRLGSARQVVICLRDEGQRLPRRTVGQRRVRWMPASYRAVHALLTNPAYAGAFVFGRTAQKRELDEQGRVRRRTVQLPIEEWSVCLPEHHPGYVSWQEYLATRERLRQNMRPRGEGGGAAREGVALLQGIVRCGRCGRRMQVAYSGSNGRSPSYACVRAFHHHGAEHPCQSLGGQRLDDAVAAAFLEAVTPAGVRACTEAVGELERQHEERLHGQRLAVERAEFEAGRAERQFDACEPENRLVARTLERAWEQALSRLESERRKLAELEARQPEPLTPAERHALARLARDLPRLWRADTTTARDRKELLRTLVGEVIVTVKEDPRRAELEIVWEGGARTALQVPLIRRGGERHRTSEDTVELIRRLAAHTDDRQIAAILNKQGAADRDRAAVQPVAREVRAPAARDPGRAAARPRQRTGDDRAGRNTARRQQRHGLPVAEGRPAARRADHPARAVADPAHRRAPRPVRARRYPTATCRSMRPPSASAARGRPSCTRSNAASWTPSKSSADDEKAYESR